MYTLCLIRIQLFLFTDRLQHRPAIDVIHEVQSLHVDSWDVYAGYFYEQRISHYTFSHRAIHTRHS